MAETNSAKKATRKAVVTLKITLRGSKPPIWRRLVMPGSTTLATLHVTIQAAMGWHDSHLHVFDIGGRQYGDLDVMDEVISENRPTLSGLVNASDRRFTYTYDFGDNWEHLVAIEKVEYPQEGLSTPICIAGKRACPPEDCGGPWGYGGLLEVLADPNHPEHKEQSEWVADNFDPEAFDIDQANITIKARVSPS